jgi:hypothetical protein
MPNWPLAAPLGLEIGTKARTPWRRSLVGIFEKARIRRVFRSYLAFRCPCDGINISREKSDIKLCDREKSDIKLCDPAISAIRYVSSS